MHVASLTGSNPTPRDNQTSVASNPGAAPSITGAVAESTHHQSPSADSLTEASAVPTIGDHVHYKESELMRMTANALEAAASHTRQASVGAGDTTGQLALSSDGRYPSLLMFPQLDQNNAQPWPLRSNSNPVSSLSAFPGLPAFVDGGSSAPATPTAPRQADAAQDSAAMPPSDAPPRSFLQVDVRQPDANTGRSGSGESSDSGMSFREMLADSSDSQLPSLTLAHEGATIAADALTSGDKAESSLAGSSDAGSPRTDLDIAASAATAWPSTATGPDQPSGERPESPNSLAKRRSSRAGSKHLQTISEAENEST